MEIKLNAHTFWSVAAAQESQDTHELSLILRKAALDEETQEQLSNEEWKSLTVTCKAGGNSGEITKVSLSEDVWKKELDYLSTVYKWKSCKFRDKGFPCFNDGKGSCALCGKNAKGEGIKISNSLETMQAIHMLVGPPTLSGYLFLNISETTSEPKKRKRSE